LELDDTTIEDFVVIFEAEWQAVLANVTTDQKAAEVVERLLGTPDWTKRRAVESE
jgi:hypothetical protein